uniref:Exonuclease domain-containing protein n=1 Tax=Leersia perrieri TaxID=77586 RepID=A0A0D9XJK3_9ORYZ
MTMMMMRGSAAGLLRRRQIRGSTRSSSSTLRPLCHRGPAAAMGACCPSSGQFVLCRPAPAGGGVTALLHARAPCRPRRRDGGSRASRAPPFRHVADDIHAILHGRIWAGHNIKIFDSNIIREAFYEIGRPPPESREMIDTYPLLRQQFGRRAGDMKMASLADYFGLGHQIHRSLVDVRMNIDVLKCCATVLFLEENLE